MPGTAVQKKAITEALANGSLDVNVLNESAARIVDYILNSKAYKRYAFSNKPDLKAHALLARQAATDGMVLLKNNSALPLHRSAGTIAAFGNTSYDFVSGGTGSGDVNEAYTISLVDGLTNAGFTIDPELSSGYTTYVIAEKAKQPKKTFFEEFANPTPRIPELDINQSLLEKKANEASVALITIGRNAGEGSDRKVENDFNLKASEVALIDAVSNAFHAKGKKVVVIINSGGVVEVSSWQDKVDAVLLSWQPGLEAGNAVADVLSGKVNPSGRLTTTFPVKYTDVASAKNFPGKEFTDKAETGMMGMKLVPAEVTYNEGIYVGYRYFNSFGVKPAYAFGYGLSYTNFNYSGLKLNTANFKGKLTASVTVTNSGSVPGKEVVQLYISAPKGKLDKPSLELKAFAKTRLLQPGQSQTVSFTINAADLASFDTGRSAWVADAGKYTIKIGASSEDIKQAADFTVAKEIVTQTVNKVLQPQVSINEEKPLIF
jgi:beta-glucosidase